MMHREEGRGGKREREGEKKRRERWRGERGECEEIAFQKSYTPGVSSSFK